MVDGYLLPISVAYIIKFISNIVFFPAQANYYHLHTWTEY